MKIINNFFRDINNLIRVNACVITKHILLFPLFVSSINSFAQGGTSCTAAQASPITIGTSYTGQTTCGKGNNYAGTGSVCLNSLYYGAEDYIYYFCAPTNGCYTFSITNLTSGVANMPAFISFSLFDGCPGTGTCIDGKYASLAANTNLAAGPSVQVNATAGNCYYIVVDAYSYSSYAGCFNFTLNSSVIPPLTQTPGGNTCTDAQNNPITIGTTYNNQTTCCAGNDYTVTGTTCIGTTYYTGNDWYYYFCATQDGCITFSMPNTSSGVSGIPVYASISAFDGCPGAATCLAGNYGYVATGTATNGPSINFQVTAGKCYYIVVDAFTGSGTYSNCANYSLASSFQPPVSQTPGGNNCTAAQANPITIGSTYNNQTTCCAGNDYTGTGSTCMGGTGTYNSANDWYYYFCATQTGCVTISMPNTSSGVTGTPVYASLSAYDGCPGSSSCLAGNYVYIAAGVTANGPSINFQVTAGKCYYIVVDGYAFGTYANCSNYSLTSSFQLPVSQTPGGAVCSASTASPLIIGNTYSNQTTCCAGNNFTGTNSCMGVTYHSANDWTYYVCPTQSGYLQVVLNNITSPGTAYPSVSVYKSSCPGTAGACVGSNFVYVSPGVAGTITLVLNAVANQCYYIVVDGYSDPYANCVNYSISTSLTPIPKNPSCNNMDFESGNLNGWFGNTGTSVAGAIGAPTPNYSLTAIGLVGGRHTIVGPTGTDPCGGFPVVGAGSYSLMLGNNSTGAQGEQVSQTFLVTAANASFTYKYAVVFQDPGHTSNQQPFFMALMKDQNGNKIPCSEFIVSAAASLPGFFNSSTCASVRYKPWSSVNVDLTSYINTYVTIEFTTGDCSAGAHFGYAYVDAQCGVSILAANNDTICPGQCAALQAPVGYGSYLWQPGNITSANANVCPSATTVYTLTLTGFNGCATTNTDTIWVAPNPVTDFTFSAPGCNKPISFTNTSTITAPATVSGYSWTFQGGTPASSNSQNPANITWASDGTYNVTLTATSSSGCTSSITKQIVVPPCTIAVSVIGDSICNGDCFTLTANPSLGVPPYVYAWSPNLGTGPGPYQVCPAATTQYTVTLTDSQGTTATEIATVAIYPSVNITATPTNITCNGKNDGTIIANPLNGPAPFTFSWSAPATSQTTQTASGLSPGDYTVTVTDKNGCTSTSSASITEPTALTSIINPGVINNCTGSGTTTATVLAGGGTPAYTYSWSDPGSQTSPTASGLTAGTTYTVMVTDNAGCTSTSSVTISGSGTPPTVAGVTSGNLSCILTSVTLTGTSPGNTITWNGGTLVNTPDPATITSPGIYTVTATDGVTGCTATSTVTVIDISAIPDISIAAPPQLTCTVASITLTGNSTTAGVNYQWTAGPATANYSVSAPGIYTLTVTDPANGCTASQTVTVTASPGIPDLSVAPAMLTCAITSVTLTCTSTTPGVIFQWINGPSSAANTVSAPGIYTVTVSDPSNGCSASQTVTVSDNITPPDISIAVPVVLSCTNTSVTLTGSSLSVSATFQWMNGPSSAVNIVSNPGIYTLTVTDPSNGCSVTQTVTVVDNIVPPDISIDVPPPLTCVNTSVTLNGNSATPNAGFQWAGGPATATNSVSAPGIYTLLVTDPGNGCTATQTVTLISNTVPPDISITPPPQITCSVTNVTLTGNSTTAGVNYQWTAGPATANYSVSAPGIYTLTVTDPANGCTASQTVTVTASPGIPDISITPAQLTCSATSVTLSGSSSTPGAMFQWTGGPASATNIVSVAAVYTLTVTDPSNGCSASKTVTVTYDTIAPDIHIAVPRPLTCTVTSVLLSGSSINTHTTFLWSGGPTTATYPVSAPGTYTLTITDTINGCTSTLTTTVSQIGGITISATSTNAICSGNNGTATAHISSGTPVYTYLWSNLQTDSLAIGLSAGDYTVTATDANGCTAVTVVTVSNTDGSVLSILPAHHSITAGNSISLNVSGGVTYTWYPSAGLSCYNCPNPVATPTITTTYTIVAIDHLGCTITAMVTITVKQACTGDGSDVFVANIFSPNNDGTNDKLYVEGNGLKDIFWSIYDRWGNLLFEAFDQSQGWDGTRKGNPLESGTYVYYLKATCISTNTDIRLKGNVSIVK